MCKVVPQVVRAVELHQEAILKRVWSFNAKRRHQAVLHWLSAQERTELAPEETYFVNRACAYDALGLAAQAAADRAQAERHRRN